MLKATLSAASLMACFSVRRWGTLGESCPHWPRPPAIPRRKWVHAAHDVVERRQTQQRELSTCGVPQWGQRQSGMCGS